jgi:hypothetical protein
MAEAAPDVFLDAIEAELRAPNGDIMTLFGDAGDPLYSRCLHSGLLWALESLAWYPPLLGRVSLVLAELAQRDPGSRWANRPCNTLAEIFLPWLPHTSASVDERISVIRSLTTKKPTPGWRLLLKLLPAVLGHSTPTHIPKWRNWAHNWRDRVTNTDYVKQVEACGKRIVEMLGTDPERWKDVIKHIGSLPQSARAEAISRLTSLPAHDFSIEKRRMLADSLRKQIQTHRAFPDARWVMPEIDILALEKALKHLEPDDPVVRDAWLFADHVQLPERHQPGWSWEQEQLKVSSMRQEVIGELYKNEGLAGLLRLSTQVRASWAVGVEFAKTGLDIDSAAIIPALLADSNSAVAGFAKGYASASFDVGGWAWLNTFTTATWTPQQLASLALILPKTQETWRLLEKHGDEAVALYWKSISIFSLADLPSIQLAVSQLLKYSRPFVALTFLAMESTRKKDLPVDLILMALEAPLLQPASATDKPDSDIAYNIAELIGNLQQRQPPVDTTRLARIEWAYIKLLDHDLASPATLLKTIHSEPQFFVDIIKAIFRPREDQGTAANEPTEEQQATAMNAYRLLRSIEKVPGSDSDNRSVDPDALAAWITEARKSCSESGHLEICDSKIGEILAWSPPEADGTWPCIAVRDAIESVGTDDLKHGVFIGILNKRGVTSRLPTDGGQLERTEAHKYESFATALSHEWPVTASVLRQLAEYYRDQAAEEDAEAEVVRRGRDG